jgi:hypothetical protein
MYRKHFALTQHPFGPEIAPEDLFPSATSRELETRLAHLWYWGSMPATIACWAVSTWCVAVVRLGKA